MTIPDGNLKDFYHISMDTDLEPPTSSLANDIAGSLNRTALFFEHFNHENHQTTPSYYYNTPPTNISASGWHEFSLSGAGGSSISSYNVDTSENGVALDPSLEGSYMPASHNKEYVFDRTDVRVVFITLYSLVFCCCFFGKFLQCRLFPLVNQYVGGRRYSLCFNALNLICDAIIRFSFRAFPFLSIASYSNSLNRTNLSVPSFYKTWMYIPWERSRKTYLTKVFDRRVFCTFKRTTFGSSSHRTHCD